jgi:isopentenyl-diphosphate delta-isomerase
MERDKVILVDESDHPLGIADKWQAHHDGLLHRAFSIFIFNSEREMLLQQRAAEKYHCGTLWTNACCSHPAPNEGLQEAVERRLREEMGFTTPVKKLFDFIYRAKLDNGLTEHEFDHVFTGTHDGMIKPDPAEVMNHRYISIEKLDEWMNREPAQFTPWFRIALPGVKHALQGELRRNI